MHSQQKKKKRLFFTCGNTDNTIRHTRSLSNLLSEQEKQNQLLRIFLVQKSHIIVIISAWKLFV